MVLAAAHLFQMVLTEAYSLRSSCWIKMPGRAIWCVGLGNRTDCERSKAKTSHPWTHRFILSSAQRLLFDPTPERSSLTAAKQQQRRANCMGAHRVLPKPRFVAPATAALPSQRGAVGLFGAFRVWVITIRPALVQIENG